jgi:hypothetical protein
MGNAVKKSKSKLINNPFDSDYLQNEIDWYGCDPYEKDDVKIVVKTLQGRCDDYLNENYRAGDIQIPILFIDGKLWMSLTYMEVQSHYMAIQMAEGSCATAGLGMGYVPLRWAENSMIDSIDVYECEERVITYFNDRFSKREGFDKINIIHGDARKLLKDKSYDYVYMDIYADLLDDAVPSDFSLFCDNNDIISYHFWGEEKVLLSARMDFGEDMYFGVELRQFFKWWCESKESGMYQQVGDDEYIYKILHLMERI